MKHTGKLIVILSVVVFCISVNSYAGKLDDFEKDATRKKDDKETKETKDTSICGEIIGGILGAIVGVFVAEGVHEIAKGGNKSGAGNKEQDKAGNDNNPADQAGVEGKPLEKRGDPIRPYARVDASYQHLSSNLKAQDYFVEFGYEPVALSGRFTHYIESDPDDSMNATEVFLLYRMEFAKKFEVGAERGR